MTILFFPTQSLALHGSEFVGTDRSMSPGLGSNGTDGSISPTPSFEAALSKQLSGTHSKGQTPATNVQTPESVTTGGSLYLVAAKLFASSASLASISIGAANEQSDLISQLGIPAECEIASQAISSSENESAIPIEGPTWTPRISIPATSQASIPNGMMAARNDANSVRSAHPSTGATKLASSQAENSLPTNLLPMVGINPMKSAYETSAVDVPDQIATEITRQLEGNADHNNLSVQIRIDQTEVGPLNLVLSMVNDVVSIRIIAQSPEAMRLVENQLGSLRKSLTRQGVACSLCEVFCGFHRETDVDNPLSDQFASVSASSARSRVVRLNFTAPPAIAFRDTYDFVA